MKKRLLTLPLFIIVLMMATAYLLNLDDAISYTALKNQHEALKNFVVSYPVAAPIVFILTYIAVAALSIPGGVWLSIFGGFLFPQPYATFYVVIGATVGACCLFAAAQTALGSLLKKRAGNSLKKMEASIQENAASYLLFLRFVPLFPFWLVNLAPAFFGVPFFTFAWTTAVGITPGAFVFTQAGAGLESLFASEKAPSLENIFTTDIKIALIALALFALLPVAIKAQRKKEQKR